MKHSKKKMMGKGGSNAPMPKSMYKKGGSMKKKYGHGGPMAKDYVGNPMGYFNDKALYGKEMMMKQDGGMMDETKMDDTKMMQKIKRVHFIMKSI